MNPTALRASVAGVAAMLALASNLAVPHRAAADKGKDAVDKIEYKGWKHNLRLSNGDVELIATLDVGPRIISFRPANGKNVFKEFTDQLGKSGEPDWQSRGGHRLWVGPEDLTRTYAPDNGPVGYKELEGDGPAVRLTPAPETEYGIQKEMDVRLAAHGGKVTVTHRITNIGDKPTELAPWALTVMAPGGVEIIPLPPHHPHPGPPKNARSARDFAANVFMAVWPYLDFKDPRWDFGSKYILLRQDANRGPTKLGLANTVGWAGYLNGGTLFVKRMAYHEGERYPDNGCNFETFTNQEMLEMESLGPIRTLAPGKSVEMVEHWDLIGDVGAVAGEADIDDHVLPKVGR